MGKWHADRFKGLLWGCVTLIWDTAIYYHLHDYGGDITAFFYNMTFLRNVGVSQLLARRLNAAWYLLSYLTSPRIRLVADFSLPMGIMTNDLILRVPWILYTFVEIIVITVLVICSFVLTLTSGKQCIAVSFIAVITMVILCVRSIIWDTVCWVTLNDLVSEVTKISTRQRRNLRRMQLTLSAGETGEHDGPSDESASRMPSVGQISRPSTSHTIDDGYVADDESGNSEITESKGKEVSDTHSVVADDEIF